jgi:hypothetical protein|tara:strand:+ start:2273 stop:2527 length:255 start_codon:yes stop_codon:yes gene_type:complete
MDAFNHRICFGFSYGSCRGDLMSKWIVGVMMLVVIAMFWKGVEVLGPSDTNKDVLYEGPKKSIEERWQDAYDWIERKRNEDQSK